MRTIIAGSRNITDYEVVKAAIDRAGWCPTVVISGAARGVDQLGERWARENGVRIVQFIAEWKTYGRRAGPLRNIKMAMCAEALIAIWDGKSRGTKHMIDTARSMGLRVHVSMVEAP